MARPPAIPGSGLRPDQQLEGTLVRQGGTTFTFVTDGIGKGVHPKIVQEMLGHSTITQTMDTYSHVLPDMQDGAVAAMQDALS